MVPEPFTTIDLLLEGLFRKFQLKKSDTQRSVTYFEYLIIHEDIISRSMVLHKIFNSHLFHEQ